MPTQTQIIICLRVTVPPRFSRLSDTMHIGTASKLGTTAGHYIKHSAYRSRRFRRTGPCRLPFIRPGGQKLQKTAFGMAKSQKQSCSSESDYISSPLTGCGSHSIAQALQPSNNLTTAWRSFGIQTPTRRKTVQNQIF